MADIHAQLAGAQLHPDSGQAAAQAAAPDLVTGVGLDYKERVMSLSLQPPLVRLEKTYDVCWLVLAYAQSACK